MLEELLQAPVLLSLSGAFATLLAIRLLFTRLSFQSQPNLVLPGPRPLPLLGNLLQLDLKRLDESLFSLSKTYGPVFTVKFGPKKVVVLAGTKAVKQALINHAEEFGERDINPLFHDFNQGHGIIFANGDSWKEMRRFTLTTLRDFGMGKRLSEEKIIEECHFLIEEFEQHKGEAFDNSIIMSYAASNIISGIMFGKRFEYKDKVFQEMIERDHETIYMAGSVAILHEIQKLHYHDENLLNSVINLFGAGTDTTGNTLSWGLLFMAKYPQIQDQVQEELSRVVGVRQVQTEDRKNLPFVNAVIHETQRLSNILPMAILHQTSKDITFQGYFIQKGTAVLPLLTSVLYDETEWETPNTFNPSHFLDEEGNFVKRDAFLPFSAGRRVCLGEGLARMELFLFFTSLLQRFRFTPPPGISEDELDLKPVVGFTLRPTPHRLCAVRRH
ncbi:cytochrome P450 2K1-like isoform X2 [Hippocampus comes]|uniref:cytochrome P450 2K1-like isoform X2 n=1 Tax=Hippocampus comes TaxID=109280 RepID=UPI00094F33F0|nr:PREDICTED: cytochrome P450 2K1-like isoform X2 [Hippocampus comes]